MCEIQLSRATERWTKFTLKIFVDLMASLLKRLLPRRALDSGSPNALRVTWGCSSCLLHCQAKVAPGRQWTCMLQILAFQNNPLTEVEATSEWRLSILRLGNFKIFFEYLKIWRGIPLGQWGIAPWPAYCFVASSCLESFVFTHLWDHSLIDCSLKDRETRTDIEINTTINKVRRLFTLIYLTFFYFSLFVFFRCFLYFGFIAALWRLHCSRAVLELDL